MELMELRVHADKLQHAPDEINRWLGRSTASKKELQSLLGTLIHLATAIRPGRRFVSRIIDMIKAERFPVSLDTNFRTDIAWWDQFMVQYNDVSLFQDTLFSAPDAVLTTDSCLTGCGGHTSFAVWILSLLSLGFSSGHSAIRPEHQRSGVLGDSGGL